MVFSWNMSHIIGSKLWGILLFQVEVKLSLLLTRLSGAKRLTLTVFLRTFPCSFCSHSWILDIWDLCLWMEKRVIVKILKKSTIFKDVLPSQSIKEHLTGVADREMSGFRAGSSYTNQVSTLRIIPKLCAELRSLIHLCSSVWRRL